MYIVNYIILEYETKYGKSWMIVIIILPVLSMSNNNDKILMVLMSNKGSDRVELVNISILCLH